MLPPGGPTRRAARSARRRDRGPRRTPVGRAGAGGLRGRLRRRLDPMVVVSGPMTVRFTRPEGSKADPGTRSAGSRFHRSRWSCYALTWRSSGPTKEGRLFRTFRGGVYQRSTLWQVLDKARPKAFTAAQAKSPLVRKPYDFAQRRDSGHTSRRVGGALGGSPRTGLCPLPRRPRRTMVRENRRRASRLAWSPGKSAGALPLGAHLGRRSGSESAYSP